MRETLNEQLLTLPSRFAPRITVMIPALNEAGVLEHTVLSLLEIAYFGRLDVLIIDDCSEDQTLCVARHLSHSHENVTLLHRNASRCHRGKGDVLNHGFAYLLDKNPQQDLSRWVIGVFDGDGCIEEADFFIEVGKAFLDPALAATQCGVRIKNRDRHLLAALQDVEFSTFSHVTQTVRDGTSGAVALGGNGQFIRACALGALCREKQGPWRTLALTEDLDIGVRILMQGGKIRFISRHVAQEGLESFHQLLRQRRRWAWGSLQVFLHFVGRGHLFKAPLPWLRKLDLLYYLSFWIVPFVVLASLGLSLAGALGVLSLSNDFPLSWIVFNSLSFVPMMVLGLWSAKVSPGKIPYLVGLTMVYAYHWVPALVSGWACILSGKQPHWAKTCRLEDVPNLIAKVAAVSADKNSRFLRKGLNEKGQA